MYNEKADCQKSSADILSNDDIYPALSLKPEIRYFHQHASMILELLANLLTKKKKIGEKKKKPLKITSHTRIVN